MNLIPVGRLEQDYAVVSILVHIPWQSDETPNVGSMDVEITLQADADLSKYNLEHKPPPRTSDFSYKLSQFLGLEIVGNFYGIHIRSVNDYAKSFSGLAYIAKKMAELGALEALEMLCEKNTIMKKNSRGEYNEVTL